ncbi:hypothetical protein IEO21_06243 [Rhodonia placenta]|uniref:Uncharacterized protein n=1 Tax=Rhodonia placenta TaxID=104341 RepID=A0A8H7P0M0_9APHY|nr:hypothetical protein IEO21_06243 [Postia placenta]
MPGIRPHAVFEAYTCLIYSSPVCTGWVEVVTLSGCGVCGAWGLRPAQLSLTKSKDNNLSLRRI